MEMPMLGFGVWQVPDGRECVQAVEWALELGYRHVDTAQAYGNEASVGAAISASGIARDELYITTKFYPQRDDPLSEIAQSVERLGVEQVDLYLVHWPRGGATWAWPGMEKALEAGYARAIGISNFDVGEIDELMAVASITPVVNQVEFSPFAYRAALLDACMDRGIALEAYSPLGTGVHLRDPTVGAIAERLGRTPAQLLLRWCIEHGVPALAKSTRRERIEENAQVFDFSLSQGDMAELDALDRTGRTSAAQESKWW